MVDYGAEGWLWALFGLSQRIYADDRSVTNLNGTVQIPAPHTTRKNWGLMRLLACLIAASVYVWQEQMEFSFSKLQFVVFILGLSILSVQLCLFRRGTTRLQPPKLIAGALGFIGRHTLEIYAIELIVFELIVNVLDLET